MATNQEKLVGLNGVAAIRDWALDNFAGGGSGSGLPSVTSEDNGDILSVVDGAWAKSEPGYRAAMVDGLVIVPEQTAEPHENQETGRFVAGLDYMLVPGTVYDWFSGEENVPDSLPVTFNSVKYDAPTTAIEQASTYRKRFYCGEIDGEGNPVLTTYPFCIEFEYTDRDDVIVNEYVVVQTIDPFTIKIAEEARDVVPTEDFKLAVNNSYTQPMVTQETFWAAQSITTEAVSGKSYAAADGPTFDYSSPVPEKLNVVFDGTAYELPNIPMLIAYGEETDQYDPDFTTYPLFLRVVDNGSYANLQLLTPQAGTYALEATYDVSTTAPTEKFKEAVKQSGGGALIVTDDGGSLDKTWQEIFDAYTSGTAVVIRTETHSGDSTQGNTEVIYSVAESVSTNTSVNQGEEIVAYYVMASENRYEASSANEYPYANSGGGGQ